jgi:adenylosuccinate synthase
MLTGGKFNVVYGGQAGSEGKGKIAVWCAIEHLKTNDNKLIFACNHMPNAGHTFVDGTFKYVARQLPTPAILNHERFGYDRDFEVYIGPGSCIDLDQLEIEIEECQLEPGINLFIHPNAGVVTDRHKKIEGGCLDNVSSTKKGGGACIASKVMRQPDSNGVHAIIRDMCPKYLKNAIADTTIKLINNMKYGATVLYEGAQGFDLDINHGLDYPFTTSRMSNVSQALAESGIPPYYMGSSIMVVRPYPIRVGNVYNEDGIMVGTSGGYGYDNEEITWEDVAEACGAPKDISITEKTTVTGKIRRVFTFSWERFKKSCMVNNPDQIFMTFADYIDYNIHGSSVLTEDQIEKIEKYMIHNLGSYAINVNYVSTGPDNSHMAKL